LWQTKYADFKVLDGEFLLDDSSRIRDKKVITENYLIERITKDFILKDGYFVANTKNGVLFNLKFFVFDFTQLANFDFIHEPFRTDIISFDITTIGNKFSIEDPNISAYRDNHADIDETLIPPNITPFEFAAGRNVYTFAMMDSIGYHFLFYYKSHNVVEKITILK